MVQLEEVEDPEIHPPNYSFDEEDDDDFTDTDSSLSADSLPADSISESLSDRLLALRDMIPPTTRRRVHSSFSTLSSYTTSGISWTGKGLWILSAGMIFLGVPFAMAWSEEVAIVEQERELRAREQAGEMMGGGQNSATPAAKPGL